MLIDTHCHLDAEHFPEGPEATLQRARHAGVEHFIVIGVGEDSGAAKLAIALAADQPDVSATVGMHPHEARLLSRQLMGELDELSIRPGVVAVGETGLDFHYMHSPAEVQERVFRRMIGLAKLRRKPLVIHTREAPELTLRIMQEEQAGDVGGVIHCFSEDRPFARRALDLGFDLSFSGIVTFKNARAVQDVARWAPADRIMVETDSPYLSPVPFRGKRCEPAYVRHTARCIADLRAEPYEQLVARTGENARRRFGLTG